MLPAWKVGDREFVPHSGIQVTKKQNVSSPQMREDSLLWGASATERIACPASRLPGLEFRILCLIWIAVSSPHPREILLAQLSL